MISTSKRLDNIEPYYFATKLAEIKSRNAKGEDIINLGIGNPDLMPPKEIIKRLNEASVKSDANGYQAYKGIDKLREAFALFYKSKFAIELKAENEILPLIGSKEGVFHIAMTYLNQGDEVLVPNPGYLAYESTARIAGASVVHYDLEEEKDWEINFDKIESLDLSKVKIMWVNYPNMPTGARGSTQLFERLRLFAERHKILVINDNPYFSILTDTYTSLIDHNADSEYLLELTSLSKAYNMAGWRVGAVVGNRLHIQNILKFKSNIDSGMYRPIQLAAIEALATTDEWINENNDNYKIRKQVVHQLLDVLGCTYSQTDVGLFVWARIPFGFENAVDFSDDLLKESKLFIPPGSIFGSNGDMYIRVSLCASDQLLRESLRRAKSYILNKSLA